MGQARSTTEESRTTVPEELRLPPWPGRLEGIPLNKQMRHFSSLEQPECLFWGGRLRD